jgi:uncharacterized membrane protein (UPF0127 family)
MVLVSVADTPWARMRGLIGRPAPGPARGLLLRPASSIHTCFMRYPIDVVFLDAAFHALSVHHALPPWRVRSDRGACAVLELRAGEATRLGIEPGKLAPCCCPPR